MAKRKNPKRKSPQKPRSAQNRPSRDDRLFTLEVQLISGPVSDEFVDRNEIVSRTILMRGDQTLDQLHSAIFDAFGRDEEHMYEFQFGGTEPFDPAAKTYVLPLALESPFGDDIHAGTVDEPLGAVGLSKGDVFFYWFDFGDDWWHRIELIDIEEQAPPGRYPRITKRVGENPPQYMDDDDWDDEDWEDEDDGGADGAKLPQDSAASSSGPKGIDQIEPAAKRFANAAARIRKGAAFTIERTG